MSGTLVNLLRKTDYIFNVGAANETILVPLVDTLNMTSGVILWRIYACVLGSATLTLSARNVMLGPDDPTTIVVAPSTADVNTTITAVAITSPTLFATNVPATTPIGRYMRFLAKTPSGTGTVTVTVAADLLMRDT